MNLRNIALLMLLAACSGGDVVAPAPSPVVKSRTIATAAEQRQAAPVVEEQDESYVDEGKFAEWLAEFRDKAQTHGIKRETLDYAFADVQPNERVIELDRKQPEKSKITKEEYLANVINDARIAKGKALLAENRDVLNDISRKTGVEPEFIVALWGLESGFGVNQGKFSIINSLSTLSYEGRRRQFFEDELLAALVIIEEGHATPSTLKGSWAGAMGQCQFMPSSFLAYAMDYDGDGKKDIWSNKKDVFASIANYLSTVGWAADKASKEKTLMHWNRSTYFVASVFELAESIK